MAYASLWAMTCMAASAFNDLVPGAANASMDFTDYALRNAQAAARGGPDALGLLHSTSLPNTAGTCFGGLPRHIDTQLLRWALPAAHAMWMSCRANVNWVQARE
jgi:hypothetical protein